MQTLVTFRSDQFPAYPGEEDRINPGIWGQRLAEYLARRLGEKGIETTEPFAEDWGWMLPVKSDSARLALCCGHQDGDDDEFIVFTDPATPIVRKVFRKIDITAELAALTAAVDAILRADPEIRGIVWDERPR